MYISRLTGGVLSLVKREKVLSNWRRSCLTLEGIISRLTGEGVNYLSSNWRGHYLSSNWRGHYLSSNWRGIISHLTGGGIISCLEVLSLSIYALLICIYIKQPLME